MSDATTSGASSFNAAEPFGMGRVVALTFGIIGRNPLAVIGIALFDALLSAGADFGIAALLTGTLGAGSGTVSLTRIASFCSELVLGGIGTGAITHVALRDVDGLRVGVGPALLTGLRLTLPLAGLSFVMGLGIGLASLLFVVPGIMVALRWTVATPVRVAEGPGLSRALARSAELTSGHRWVLFGLAVAFVLLVLVFAGLVVLLLDRGNPGPLGSAADFISQTALSTLATVLLSTGMAACYAEFRRTKEGATPDQLAAIFT